MRRYPVTHSTPAGLVVERGENQFFIRLYVGKTAGGIAGEITEPEEERRRCAHFFEQS